MNRPLPHTPTDDLPERATRAWWDRAYGDDQVRWDTGVTPPEVQTFWRSGLLEASGTAVDLGCGTGTNTIFLASLGLSVIGIEHSSVALLRAHARVRHFWRGGGSTAWFVQGDVTSLPLCGLMARYVLDIGCFHSLPRARRSGYAAGVIGNLAPGGFFHLYAHDASIDNSDGPDGRGVGAKEVVELFTPELELATVQRGRPDPTPARWYLLYKPIARTLSA